MSELTRGRELAKQLTSQLDSLPLPEKCDLLEKLLSCYDKALPILNWKQQSSQQIRDYSSLKGILPLDGGHFWRKYGQKDILGANRPRAYYRCTHRKTQGCLATKQVQMSDEDPSVFEVTYKGKHSCSNTSQFRLQQAKEVVFNFGQEQKLEILDTKHDVLPPFSFPSIKSQDADSQVFSKPTKETDLIKCCSLAPFMSPTSSESTYLSSLLGHNDNYDFGLSQILLGSESDLTEQLISTPPSVTDSPFGDYNLPADPSEFWS